jgi:hypothetical protein
MATSLGVALGTKERPHAVLPVCLQWPELTAIRNPKLNSLNSTATACRPSGVHHSSGDEQILSPIDSATGNRNLATTRRVSRVMRAGPAAYLVFSSSDNISERPSTRNFAVRWLREGRQPSRGGSLDARVCILADSSSLRITNKCKVLADTLHNDPCGCNVARLSICVLPIRKVRCEIG